VRRACDRASLHRQVGTLRDRPSANAQRRSHMYADCPTARRGAPALSGRGACAAQRQGARAPATTHARRDCRGRTEAEAKCGIWSAQASAPRACGYYPDRTTTDPYCPPPLVCFAHFSLCLAVRAVAHQRTHVPQRQQNDSAHIVPPALLVSRHRRSLGYRGSCCCPSMTKLCVRVGKPLSGWPPPTDMS
jgi:hypothetical protein